MLCIAVCQGDNEVTRKITETPGEVDGLLLTTTLGEVTPEDNLPVTVELSSPVPVMYLTVQTYGSGIASVQVTGTNDQILDSVSKVLIKLLFTLLRAYVDLHENYRFLILFP